MAVFQLLRCSPSPPLPPLRRISPLRQPFAGALLPGCRGTRIISSSVSCRITSMEGGSMNVTPVPDFCTQLTKHIPFHKMLSSTHLPLMVLLAHMPALILPPQALAETCEPGNPLFNMPLLLAIALVGATVGGLLARQRKGELERLNEQLRQINTALRRQAKIESYAPNLSYAPVSKVPESEVIVDPRKEQLITRLRTGKNYLRNQDPEKAFGEFKYAFDLAGAMGDHIEEKKAARGLGASLQRQGKYREAIKYHSKVLEIAKRNGEESGSTEAYGAIADCYTELGDLERAAKFYDKYISRLESD